VQQKRERIWKVVGKASPHDTEKVQVQVCKDTAATNKNSSRKKETNLGV